MKTVIRENTAGSGNEKPIFGRSRAVFFQMIENHPKLGLNALQFRLVGRRQIFQQVKSARGNGDEDTPPVLFVGRPGKQPRMDHAIDQADRAVMSNPQAFGKLPDSDRVAPGESPDRKQGLVLLRRNPGPRGSPFAEMDKTAQGIAKSREQFVVLF